LIVPWGLAPLRATEPKEAGLNELVVQPPGVHSRGLPAVEFKSTEDGVKVEIPPTVHVHRFYYSGDKEYQGPYVAGGPTIVVANHPRTNERMYVDVMLPTGFPIVEYTEKTITYIYPNQRVTLTFVPFSKTKVSVKYEHGQGLERKLHQWTKGAGQAVGKTVKSSKLSGTLGGAAKGAGQLAVGVGGVVETAADAGLQTVGKVVGMFPGVKTLQSAGKQAAERRAADSLRRAEKVQLVAGEGGQPSVREALRHSDARLNKSADDFIATVR
jgi:hypothetical protein